VTGCDWMVISYVVISVRPAHLSIILKVFNSLCPDLLYHLDPKVINIFSRVNRIVNSHLLGDNGMLNTILVPQQINVIVS
jgi:hypothetical protein